MSQSARNGGQNYGNRDSFKKPNNGGKKAGFQGRYVGFEKESSRIVSCSGRKIGHAISAGWCRTYEHSVDPRKEGRGTDAHLEEKYNCSKTAARNFIDKMTEENKDDDQRF